MQMTDTDPGDHGTKLFCLFFVFTLGDHSGHESKFSGKLRNVDRIHMAKHGLHRGKILDRKSVV